MGERAWVVCREWRDLFGTWEYEIAGVYTDEECARAVIGPGCWIREFPLNEPLPSDAPRVERATQASTQMATAARARNCSVCGAFMVDARLVLPQLVAVVHGISDGVDLTVHYEELAAAGGDDDAALDRLVHRHIDRDERGRAG